MRLDEFVTAWVVGVGAAWVQAYGSASQIPARTPYLPAHLRLMLQVVGSMPWTAMTSWTPDTDLPALSDGIKQFVQELFTKDRQQAASKVHQRGKGWMAIVWGIWSASGVGMVYYSESGELPNAPVIHHVMTKCKSQHLVQLFPLSVKSDY